MNIKPVEFFGGPHDGALHLISPAVESMVIREGASLHRYDRDEIVEGPKARQIFRRTLVSGGDFMDEDQIDWQEATPELCWATGGLHWVTIRCAQDGTQGVGIFAGGPSDSIAITKGVDVKDGRDYVVTHYCPMTVKWPNPAGEGK